jgi:hypothetical protein
MEKILIFILIRIKLNFIQFTYTSLSQYYTVILSLMLHIWTDLAWKTKEKFNRFAKK